MKKTVVILPSFSLFSKKVTDGHIINAEVSFDITKAGYRLPTEAEWEFAARVGNPSSPEWNYFFSGHESQFRCVWNGGSAVCGMAVHSCASTAMCV